jgi:NADH-quinone oxidoreductase subunit L
MRAPLLLLAVPTVLLGLVALWQPLVSVPGEVPHTGLELGTTAVVLLVTLVGVLGAWQLWRRDPAADPADALGPLRPVFENAFYVDAVQDALVVRPTVAVARAVATIDVRLVDGAVEGTARAALRAGRELLEAQAQGLARQLTLVLTGAVLLGAAAVALSGVFT